MMSVSPYLALQCQNLDCHRSTLINALPVPTTAPLHVTCSKCGTMSVVMGMDAHVATLTLAQVNKRYIGRDFTRFAF